MAYLVKETWYNGYRCACCTSSNTTEKWFDDPSEALGRLHTEFPTECEGGVFRVLIYDGSESGALVAESRTSWPPAFSRGDGYKYTRWRLWVNEDAFPGQGKDVEQIIPGTNFRPMKGDYRYNPDEHENPDPLLFVTDRSWDEIISEFELAAHKTRLEKAQKDLEKAQKELSAIQGSDPKGTPVT